MSVIIPRQHLRQPPLSARPDFEKYPTLRMLFHGGGLFLRGPRGLLSTSLQGLSGDPRKVGPRGIYTEFWPNGAGPSTIQTIQVQEVEKRSSDFTAFAEYAGGDNAFSLQVFHGPWIGLLMSNADVRARATVLTPAISDEYAIAAHSTSELNVYRRGVARNKGTELKAFSDSGVVATTTTSGMLYNPDALQNRVIGTSGRGHCTVAAYFDSALSDKEVDGLLDNPWQLFRADPIRIYSLPSGPISISWSSLTASNITPTTATLTIGGIVR